MSTIGIRYASGSLTNRIAEQCLSTPPKVGDGATIIRYSDRNACTVVAVSEHRQGVKVIVQRDKAIRADSNGQSESQEYRYEPDPAGATYTFTRRKNGQYVEEGSSLKGGNVVRFGEREEYFDFSF